MNDPDPMDLECDKPPFGWRCTRTIGHDWPCAAVEAPEDIDFVSEGMDRLRAAGFFFDHPPAGATGD